MKYQVMIFLIFKQFQAICNELLHHLNNIISFIIKKTGNKLDSYIVSSYSVFF